MATKTVKKTENKPKTTKKTTVKKEVTKKPVTKKKEIVKPVEKKEEVKPIEKKNVLTKKNIIIGVSILFIVLLLVFLILFLTNPKRKIKNTLEDIGKDFYTNYYYDQLANNRSKEDLQKVLKRFSINGFNLNLDYLSSVESGKYKKEIESLKYKKKDCNKDTTKVRIFPVEPYGKTDYRIELELDCGF